MLLHDVKQAASYHTGQCLLTHIEITRTQWTNKSAFCDPSTAGPMYVRISNVTITAPMDVLELKGARLSAATALTKI